ncbi:hypothetical protein B8043_25110 [Klebsiella aerogenes]|nr:hypothetical protein AM407_13750 [Klebsiella aerogenes]KJM44233.1 hypothetical protein SS20_16000 [Klebsiella aerogenes]KKY72564.1 hypothetical protein OA41_02085 [Klebsiella aerogenes]OVK32029.1 hypothetical protein B8043_25110 [Klebsiella aerogenes]
MTTEREAIGLLLYLFIQRSNDSSHNKAVKFIISKHINLSCALSCHFFFNYIPTFIIFCFLWNHIIP